MRWYAAQNNICLNRIVHVSYYCLQVSGNQLKAVENVPKQQLKGTVYTHMYISLFCSQYNILCLCKWLDTYPIGLVAPSSRIQPPNQPASYRLRSQQSNANQAPPPSSPQLQQEPRGIPSAKKQIPHPVNSVAPVSHLPPPPSSGGPDREKASVAPVSHLPPPPSSAGPDREKASGEAANGANKPSAGE